jgi:hypothetical protein
LRPAVGQLLLYLHAAYEREIVPVTDLTASMTRGETENPKGSPVPAADP